MGAPLPDKQSPASVYTNRTGVILSPADTDRILAAAGRGPVALRNTALVVVMLGNGLDIEGLRNLKVRDFLEADGSVRREVRLEPTLNGREARTLYWLNPRVVDPVEAYLGSRAASKVSANFWRAPSKDDAALAYRGLDPDSPLFPAHDDVHVGARRQWVAGETNVTTSWLSELLCSIFQQAGVYASPTRSARLTLAYRMLYGGADEATVARVLGLRGRDLLRRLRPLTPRRSAEEALAGAL